MIGYKLLKLGIFVIYWLGFAPWLVMFLQSKRILFDSLQYSLKYIFLQYTTCLFVLIMLYIIIYQMFEYFYTRYKIKRVVRKVTIRHQLQRLENGEIDLIAAQRFSTFTKIKEEKPKNQVKRNTQKKATGNGQEKRKGGSEKSNKGMKEKKSGELEKKRFKEADKEFDKVDVKESDKKTKKQNIDNISKEDDKGLDKGNIDISKF